MVLLNNKIMLLVYKFVVVSVALSQEIVLIVCFKMSDAICGGSA